MAKQENEETIEKQSRMDTVIPFLTPFIPRLSPFNLTVCSRQVPRSQHDSGRSQCVPFIEVPPLPNQILTGAADPTSNERRNQRMLHLQYGALLIQPSLYRLALFMDISLLLL